MAHNDRHGKNKKEKRTPYTGFENTHKRDAKGHFVKQDNGDKSKTHNDGNNCYKNSNLCRANENSVVKKDVVVPDFGAIMNNCLEKFICSLEEAKKAYDTKPIYSRKDMVCAIHKTRTIVLDEVRRRFHNMYLYWLIGGCAIGIAVGSISVIFGPSIINFVKNLFV